MSARPKLTQIDRAREGWGEQMPPEIAVLAEACSARTSRAVAKQLGYSDATISFALANKYQNGDLPKLFAAIRGLLMGETVDCPENGELRRDMCLRLQARPFNPTNSASARQYHACRRCPLRQQKDVA